MIKAFASGSHGDGPADPTVRDLRLQDDESLMAHVKASNGDALAVLFDRYQRLVYYVALKILRNIEDAEDVVQNVFLEISRVAWQFDPRRGTARAWILLYAYHRSMDRRQQLQRYYNTFAGVDVLPLLARSQNDTEGSLLTKRQLEMVLGILKPMQKRILELACFEGLSFKEIAQLVGETTGNVRHHYYRALCKLRISMTNVAGSRQEGSQEGARACERAPAGVLP
jgi:RNA polymerase sigma-70 factor (ECF subfamily)